MRKRKWLWIVLMILAWLPPTRRSEANVVLEAAASVYECAMDAECENPSIQRFCWATSVLERAGLMAGSPPNMPAPVFIAPVPAPPNVVSVKYSHYWPPLGGVNCFSFVQGSCISRMASGERWEDWVDRAVACPPEWPFWTTVTLDGLTWTCLDRGGAIKFTGGVPFVDFLTPTPAYPFKTIVEVEVIFP